MASGSNGLITRRFSTGLSAGLPINYEFLKLLAVVLWFSEYVIRRLARQKSSFEIHIKNLAQNKAPRPCLGGKLCQI
jgi:hypothetical protein